MPQGAVVSAVSSPVARFSLMICSLLYSMISKKFAAGGSSFVLSIYSMRTASSFSFLQKNIGKGKDYFSNQMKSEIQLNEGTDVDSSSCIAI